MFGSATDGKNIYASNANLEFRSFTLINSRPNRPGQPAPTTTDGGLLASVVGVATCRAGRGVSRTHGGSGGRAGGEHCWRCMQHGA